MATTLYTETLARAAEIQGSTQALAGLLHVPENTLLRWMSGRAQMPLRAFLKLVQLVSEHEKASGEPGAAAGTETRRTGFRMGPLQARCARCDGEEFMAPAPLGYTSKLTCVACGEQVAHGNLVAQLAKEAVLHSRIRSVARAKRQSALRDSPKPRALSDAREVKGKA